MKTGMITKTLQRTTLNLPLIVPFLHIKEELYQGGALSNFSDIDRPNFCLPAG